MDSRRRWGPELGRTGIVLGREVQLHRPGYKDGEEECNGQGLCLDGKCNCIAGFGLLDKSKGPNTCADPVCVADCGKHGTCESGTCNCQPGWKGVACNEPECPGDCTGHGICSFVQPDAPGQCKCEFGWVGRSARSSLPSRSARMIAW